MLLLYMSMRNVNKVQSYLTMCLSLKSHFDNIKKDHSFIFQFRCFHSTKWSSVIYVRLFKRMNPTRSENFLALSYITSFLLSTTSSILFIVVYQHWVWTLGHCVNPNNCLNCILYGVNTFETFMGGDVKVCQFCSYALVPSIIISLALGIFHIYRRCMSNNLNSPKISVYVKRYSYSLITV